MQAVINLDSFSSLCQSTDVSQGLITSPSAMLFWEAQDFKTWFFKDETIEFDMFCLYKLSYGFYDPSLV